MIKVLLQNVTSLVACGCPRQLQRNACGSLQPVDGACGNGHIILRDHGLLADLVTLQFAESEKEEFLVLYPRNPVSHAPCTCLWRGVIISE